MSGSQQQQLPLSSGSWGGISGSASGPDLGPPRPSSATRSSSAAAAGAGNGYHGFHLSASGTGRGPPDQVFTRGTVGAVKTHRRRGNSADPPPSRGGPAASAAVSTTSSSQPPRQSRSRGGVAASVQHHHHHRISSSREPSPSPAHYNNNVGKNQTLPMLSYDTQTTAAASTPTSSTFGTSPSSNYTQNTGITNPPHIPAVVPHQQQQPPKHTTNYLHTFSLVRNRVDSQEAESVQSAPSSGGGNARDGRNDAAGIAAGGVLRGGGRNSRDVSPSRGSTDSDKVHGRTARRVMDGKALFGVNWKCVRAGF